MKITLVAVGKIKEKFFVDAIKEYEKRLSRFCNFSVVEVAESLPSKSCQEQIEEENKRLLEKCKGCVVAFDLKGEHLTSEQFADFFDKTMSNGQSEFTFLIGGSNGLGEELRKKVDKKLAFSKLTFPHQLFRVMAVEQIYRALTINAGLPYHK